MFSVSGAGFNQVVTKSGSSYMTNGNKPDKIYEGWAASIANTKGYRGLLFGTGQNIPMFVANGGLSTLRGTAMPTDGLGTKIRITGNIEGAPTNVLKEENKGYIYYDSNQGCTLEWDGKKWVPVDVKIGTTDERPSFNTTEAPIYKGLTYYDTTLNKPIWWSGSAWIDKDGNPADAKKQGKTDERPSNVQIGYIYKDISLGKLVLWNGFSWVNMDGTTL